MRFLILALILITQTTFADYQAGLDAYNAYDYKKALRAWKAVTRKSSSKVSPATLAETNYAIGMLYWMGEGVDRDQLEASIWLHKAAELGHAGAQGKLGYFYTVGLTVPQDYDIAFEWFSKAAEQGDADGEFNLGIFYLNGWGVEQDKTMAAQYLSAASAQGDGAAEAALQELSGPEYGKPKSDVIPLAESWILSQNPDDYTIQVVAVHSIQDIEKLVQGFDHLAPFAIYTLQRNSTPLHLLVQGVYPNVESARTARDEFPTAIEQPDRVWIRKFGKIQELINPPAQPIAPGE